MKTCLVGLLALVCLGQQVVAQQSLNVSLFERYLVLYREQLAIPGVSAAILQGGRVVWSGGFGQANVANNTPARADTSYPILGLSQALSSTVLLRRCADFSHLEVTDRVRRWVPDHGDEALTIAEVLSHTNGAGQYQYDPVRFALVDEVLKQCANAQYPALIASELLDRFSMIDSVPGADVVDAASPVHGLFEDFQLDRYAGALSRLAVPYRVDDSGRATAAPFTPGAATASSGLISSALDLARFDLALRDGFLLPDTQRLAWTPAAGTSAALGWFVQRIGSDTVVWQYGLEPGGYSSMLLKVPGRDLTLVLLANSDAVAAPLATGAPDVNASPFARLFFRIFLV